jgi:putative hydrolase
MGLFSPQNAALEYESTRLGDASGKLEAASKWQTGGSVVAKMRQAADILTAQAADPFRIAAYRQAADALIDFREDEDIVVLFERSGRPALKTIPGIGTSISAAIAEC